MAIFGLAFLALIVLLGRAALVGGIVGLIMMVILAVLGESQLLTPSNLLLYELIWMIPGFLITEWTRSL